MESTPVRSLDRGGWPFKGMEVSTQTQQMGAYFEALNKDVPHGTLENYGEAVFISSSTAGLCPKCP